VLGINSMSLHSFLAMKGASLRLKGKIYKACVQGILVYGSDTGAMKVKNMKRLERI